MRPFIYEVEDGERLKRAIAREDSSRLLNMKRCVEDFWQTQEIFLKKNYRRQVLQKDFIIQN